MNEPTPHHPTHIHSDTQQPTAVGAEPSQVDFVAGEPPVPITVWRTARTPADAGRQIGARLAARLVAAYSRPGDEVVDLTPGHTLAAACTAGGRAHLPAWFTDASSLIIGPTTTPGIPSGADAPHPQTEPPRGRRGRNRDEEPEAPELSTWFGDDLTDPDLPGSHPTTDTPAANITPRTTGLVVAGWPLHEQEAANRIRLAWLLTVCARLLRPGGCLILVVTVPPGTVATPEDFTPMVQAAAGTGLGYLQHIVAVHATIGIPNNADNDGGDGDGGDAFVYHVTDEELLTLASTTGHGWAVAHLRVHADLLVFSRTQNADRDSGGARAGKAGGRRA